NAAAWQAGKNRLCLRVKADGRFARRGLLERMANQRPGLVMNDSKRMGKIRWSIVLPRSIVAHGVFGALPPLKTNAGGRGWLGASSLDRAPGELIDLIACCRGLDRERSALFRHTLPWIWHGFVKQLGIEPMDDAPSMATDGDNLFALPKSGSPRSFNDNRIYFICGSRRDSTDGQVNDLVAMLSDTTTDQFHTQ